MTPRDPQLPRESRQLTAACLYSYPLRMADAPNPASALAKLRWGDAVLRRSIETLAARSAELTDAQRVRLRELADAPKEDK